MSTLAASEPAHDVMEEAAEWYALLRTGQASSAERQQWRQWLDRGAEQRQAWSYVERIDRRFTPLQTSPDRDAAVSAFHQAISAAPRRRRQVLLGLGAAFGLSWLGWSAWRQTPLSTLATLWGTDYRAGVGETRQVTLADGTRVWINALSAFNVAYSGTQRRLQLVAGEILIDTGKDPLRPFFVDTGQGSLQALGTRFSVSEADADTLVAVYDGAVRVTALRSGASEVVSAGRQARFTRDTLQPMTPADPARESWRQGLLLADGTPLSEVVAALRRYHPGHLGLSPQLRDLPVFGSYPLNDVDRALDMLASVLPIRLQRTLPWWISLEPRA
ncbi:MULTISPECIES: FecR family protein [Achromobacter]|uniref:FecR family protein n=1 Tax=Achromobacter spanius TaxID=217203 RepID=A0ABY8GWJ6_9BURK|nr:MULTISPECIES: FecR family protein [Achromobacter]WAI81610.1 FecR family protein [Achromobacter spanius]WEX97128.1 FecR family protein [Achromobacter sp. SS2-2022]WFP09156.1 FecR family protein [Achromobacter spanius]